MVEFSEQDTYLAEYIVEALMSNDEESFSTDNNIVVDDLELDVAQFFEELRFLEELQADVPAIKVDENQSIPISLRTLFPEYPIVLPADSVIRDIFALLIVNLVERFSRTNRNFEQDERLHFISRTDARATFKRLAIIFLATRIAFIRSLREGNLERNWGQLVFLNLRQRIGGVKVVTPGCHFDVSTNSPGLRVFWSGAYYLSANYFSHPTSPATSVLQAGTYVFGVDGGVYGNKIQWDTNAVISLPGQPFVHLNY